jgi:apolipoprotein N-acyltransferase
VSQSTDRSIPDLLGDLVDQTSTLVRKEVQLARAEFSEKLSAIGVASGSLAIGGVLLLAALIILLQAIVAFLVEYAHLSATVSALIVAVVVAVIGYGVLRGGLNRLKASNLTPDRTVAQLSQDARVVKEQVR